MILDFSLQFNLFAFEGLRLKLVFSNSSDADAKIIAVRASREGPKFKK